MYCFCHIYLAKEIQKNLFFFFSKNGHQSTINQFLEPHAAETGVNKNKTDYRRQCVNSNNFYCTFLMFSALTLELNVPQIMYYTAIHS